MRGDGWDLGQQQRLCLFPDRAASLGGCWSNFVRGAHGSRSPNGGGLQLSATFAGSDDYLDGEVKKQPEDGHVFSALEAALFEALQKVLQELRKRPVIRK